MQILVKILRNEGTSTLEPKRISLKWMELVIL